MVTIPEILIEGSYDYFQNEVNYSQESFKLTRLTNEHSYKLHAEITSRIETGEFLKILVEYEMNQHFYPTKVKIEKNLGNKYASELYTVDIPNLELHYTFQNSQTTHEFSRNFGTKHYIATPAISASAIFTHTKKFDATGKTPIILLGSDNDWEYKGPPTEKTIYAEYETREMTNYKLNGSPLSASHLCLFESDSSSHPTQASHEVPVNIYLSKHYGIPYQLVQGDLNIVIKKLKKHS